MKRPSNIRYLGGLRAGLIRMRILATFWKYILQRSRYPFFVLSPSKGGLLKSLRTVKDLKLRKVVKSNGTYRYCLTIPRWPSRPHDHLAGMGGLNINAAGTEYKHQIDHAFLAVTRKCAYRCRHCYERFNIPAEETVPLDVWKRAVRELQAMGTGIIVFSGGEPMLRFDDLLELVRSGDKDLSEFHVNTSGHGVTEAKARALKAAGLEVAGVGLDDVNRRRHDALRGHPGAFDKAVRAIRIFQEAGLFTYINLCLTRDLVRSGDLPSLMDMAKNLGVGAVRFLEPVPVGGYSGQDPADLFSADDRAATVKFYELVSQSRSYRNYPFISYEAYSESPERLGCMMGGLSHFSIDSLGNVLPCVFLPVSFGNIRDQSLPSTFLRMKQAIPRPCRKGCPAVLLAEPIKRKGEEGLPLPIDFSAMEDMWRSLYADSTGTPSRPA